MVTPKLVELPLSTVRNCLLNIIAATLHIEGHLQLAYAPLCCERDPLILGCAHFSICNAEIILCAVCFICVRSVGRMIGYLRGGTRGMCHRLKTHLILANIEPAE